MTVSNFKKDNKPLLTDSNNTKVLKKIPSNKNLIKKNNPLNITAELDSSRKQVEPKTSQMIRNMTTNNLLKSQTLKTPLKTSENKKLETLKKNSSSKQSNVKSYFYLI
jgi:hypothetical protein